MKIIGLVGGTSYLSTVDYYKRINEGINQNLGALNFSECLVYSFNFQQIKNMMDTDNWSGITSNLISVCKKLQNSGVHCIVLCANTLHYVADEVQKSIDIPIINIATATAKSIQKQNLTKVGLLGTKFTMEYDFFKESNIDEYKRVLLRNSGNDYLQTHFRDAMLHSLLADFDLENIAILGHRNDQMMFEQPGIMSSFAIPGLELLPVEINHWVDEGDVLDLWGREVEVRHCPGHCPGNVVFWVKSENRCFVGDVIFAGSVGRSDLPGGDFETLEKSIRKNIYTLPNDTILHPGHGEETRVFEEKRSNPFVLSS